MFKKLVALLFALVFILQTVVPSLAFAGNDEPVEIERLYEVEDVTAMFEFIPAAVAHQLVSLSGRVYQADGSFFSLNPSWQSVPGLLVDEGELVEIRAIAVAGYGAPSLESQLYVPDNGWIRFLRWDETGGIIFADRYNHHTTFVMPPNDATFRAIFEVVAPVTEEMQGWVEVDGYWFFYEAGVRQTGWLQRGTRWFFLNESDGRMETGWLQRGARWFFLHETNGHMLTGWVQSSGNWFFLHETNGHMLTGWLQRGANWYFLASSGRMQTGWLRRGTNWYFLANSGRMQTGWVQVGSNWFFMASSGRMQTGRVMINGVPHLFNASGVWQGRG